MRMWMFVTLIQAITQLYGCRQQLDQAGSEKSSLEADVARLSKECDEAAARLHASEVFIIASCFLCTLS